MSTALVPASLPSQVVPSNTLATRMARIGLMANEDAVRWLRNLPALTTRENYARSLVAFAEWLHTQTGKDDPASASFDDLLAYQEHLHSGSLKPSTAEAHMRRLGSFFAFLEVRGVLAHSPMAGLHIAGEQDDTAKRAWSPQEIWAFEAAIPADGSLLSLRDRALFSLLFRNGLRVSEACKADVGDLTVKSGHAVLEVKGKGARGRTKKDDVVLIERTVKDIQAYLTARGIGLGGVLRSDESAKDWRALPLFEAVKDEVGRKKADGTRKDGRRLIRQTVNKRMVVIGRKAGIDPSLLHPHACRHTFASTLAEAGVPLHKIRVATRHSSLATLEPYLHQRDKIMDNAAKQIRY